MKDKETINSSRAILLIKVANELFKFRKYETMKINSISLSKIDEQYNFNNFEMNFQNPIEIGKSMTGISRSYLNISKKKVNKNTRDRDKKYSYKRPKFLYRIGMNSSNILNIINQINDIDLNKIRKRKVISEAKFKEIETPSTNNNIFDSQEKTLLEEQALNYLRDLAKNLKDITQCRNNRKSMKCIKTIRLSVAENNVIKEKIKNSINKNENNKIDKLSIENYENEKDMNNKDKNNKIDYNKLKINKKRSITFILPVSQIKKNDHFIINQSVNKD